MSAELLATRRDATLVLTLSNPGLKNALHPDLLAAAIESLSTAEREDTLRAVVLTGAGGYFSAGGNLKHMLEARAREHSCAAEVDALHSLVQAILDCPKPVIAAVEGGAAGAGFSLAMACDLVVAAQSAKFEMSFVKVGLTPNGGGSWMLPRALPRQLVAEMLIEGVPLPVERLHGLGLVNRVVPDGAALDSALAWADSLARLPAAAVERIKGLLAEAPHNSLQDHFAAEKHAMVESLRHHDAQEGIRAFLDKRPPKFA